LKNDTSNWVQKQTGINTSLRFFCV